MIRTTRKQLFAAVPLALGMASAPAMAYQAGDFIVRGGIASVVPGGSYSEVADGAYNLRANSDQQVGLSLSYMMTDAFSVNLLAASPFRHDIQAQEFDGATIGETRHLPPTLTVSWYPTAGMDLPVRPYIGAGVNYTTFFEEDLNAAGRNELGTSDLELDDSFGMAAQVGVDVPIDDQWSVGAAAYYMDIETDVEVGGNDIGTVEIDPMVYRLHMVYRF